MLTEDQEVMLEGAIELLRHAIPDQETYILTEEELKRVFAAGATAFALYFDDTGVGNLPETFVEDSYHKIVNQITSEDF